MTEDGILYCDCCLKTLDMSDYPFVENPDDDELRFIAKEQGWKIGFDDFCPDCEDIE